MKKRKLLPPVRQWQVVIAVLLLIIVLGIGLWFYLQGKNVAILEPQGIVGQNEKKLILFTVLLSVIVVVPVYVMLGMFAWRYRDDNKKAKYKYTPDVDGNKWLEILWWGIPVVIIGILSVVTWASTHQLDPYKPLNSKVAPINVQVVALPWRWLFLYPDQHVATINELKIPAGTPVNFAITADAPMSAFWIPNLGTQTYAMTGMTAKLSLEADHAGTYRGENTNINGKGYADMTFKVTVVPTRKDFDTWAAGIPSDAKQQHLEWSEYETLAKQSTDEKVQYFSLHDVDLYNEVIAKYTSNGSVSATQTAYDNRGDD